jgi:hypothetical protein
MESFVYIISCQRGQGLPEIRSVWTDYEDAVLAYCEDLEDWNNQDFYLFHKLPVGRFVDPGGWCKEKLGKSSKNRIKFPDIDKVKKQIVRDRKLSDIID